MTLNKKKCGIMFITNKSINLSKKEYEEKIIEEIPIVD